MAGVKILKIVSGGQTGADRAALDFALENGLEIGGFVPKDRFAENGRIPDKYQNLIETETVDPAERTELNVVHSDATLIISHGELSGGSAQSEQLALRYKKSVLHTDLNKQQLADAVKLASNWLTANDIRTLNIAGPRISEDAEIYASVMSFLRLLFADIVGHR